MLGDARSGYNAAANSILVADLRPSSPVVRTSAASELRGSWIKLIEGNESQQFALLGFSDSTGDEGRNQQLRADRARAVAALLPATANAVWWVPRRPVTTPAGELHPGAAGAEPLCAHSAPTRGAAAGSPGRRVQRA